MVKNFKYMKKKIAILGSTGSIGKTTINIVKIKILKFIIIMSLLLKFLKIKLTMSWLQLQVLMV